MGLVCPKAFLKRKGHDFGVCGVYGGTPPTQGKLSQLVLPPGPCSQDPGPINNPLPSNWARAL